MNERARFADVAAPVRVPKTAELVASHLRRQIVRGELKEGDALPPESALMEQFGVSRPTLREAFRVLESEALISVRRGARAARVSTPPTVTSPPATPVWSSSSAARRSPTSTRHGRRSSSPRSPRWRTAGPTGC